MSLINYPIIQPKQLYWWQWGKLVGLLLPILLGLLGSSQPLFWAIAIHFLMDFTLQSSDTSAAKGQGQFTALSYHAFLSGGYPGLIVGGLPGLALSALIHFVIDATNKFGLKEPYGPLLDQSLHILTLILLASLFTVI